MPEPDVSREMFDKFVSGKARTITNAGPEVVVERSDDILSAADDTDVSALGAEHVTLVKTVNLAFDVKLGTWLVNLNPIPGERPLRDAHVADLLTKMQRGCPPYLPETVNLAACEVLELKRVVRINGQHSGWARTMLEEDKDAVRQFGDPLVALHLYRAKNLKAAHALYAQYDRGAPRTRGNLVESYLSTVPPFDKYGSRVRKILAGGLSYYLWPKGHERSRHDVDSVVSLMQSGDHKPALVHTGDLIDAVAFREARHLCRTTVVAALIATFHVDPVASTAFWTVVRDGTGVDATTDARLKLRNDLLAYGVGTSSGTSKSSSVALSGEYVYALCAQAWKYWRLGRPVSRLSIGRAGIENPIFK
jgi:hypothetical protein